MKMRKTLSMFVCLLMVATVFIVTPVSLVAEEPEEPWFPEEPEYPEEPEEPGLEGEGEWWVKGNGTYFELTNSTYLNIIFTSSENVHLYLESIPKMINYHIERNCTANSTDITISGFEAGTIYYRYQDGYLQEEFTTDESATYSYIQDISTNHHVYIQEEFSTLYISSDYTFTGDINEPIVVEADNIVIDGNGYALQGPGWGTGFYLNGRSGVTIKNVAVSGFRWGIYLYYSNSNTISTNTFPSCPGAIRVFYSSGNTIEGNMITENGLGIYQWVSSDTTIIGNTISNGNYGIYTEDAYRNTIIGNTISNNQNFAVCLEWTSNNIINDNIITDNNLIGSESRGGIWLTGSRDDTISGNTISNNGGFGMLLGWGVDRNTITGNSISNHQVGIDLYLADDCTVDGNTVLDSIEIGIELDRSDRAIVTGNTIINGDYGILILGSFYATLSGNVMERTGIYFTGIGWNTHTIDTSNKVNGKDVLCWKDVNGGTIHGCYGQVFLINCMNVVVEKQDVSDTTIGIMLRGSSGNTIVDNVACNNHLGGILVSNLGNTVSGNNVSNNKYGLMVGAQNSIINNNIVLDNEAIGIRIFGRDNMVSDNIVSGNSQGIYVRGGGHTISGNSVSNNMFGIHSDSANEITISDNSISANDIGIRIGASSGITVSGNSISTNEKGIHGLDSQGTTVNTNTVSDNIYGIHLIRCGSYTMIGNTISTNNYGVYLDYSNSNTIFHNNIIDNTNQLYCYQSTNTWDNGANEGNYWNDYTGEDTDGDGVGDTELPYPGIVVDPISYWKLDEESGVVASDSVGTNDGTLVNGPIWTTGQVAGALSFDGVDDYVDCGNNPSLTFGLGVSFTYESWIYAKSTTGKWRGIIYHGHSYASQGHLGISPGGYLGGGSGDGFSWRTHVTSYNVPSNEWIHVVMSLDRNTDTLTFYANGNEVGSFSHPYIPSTPTRSLVIGLGAQTYGSEYFNGFIDEVAIWNRALSSTEIQQHHNDGLAGTPISVILGVDWYPLVDPNQNTPMGTDVEVEAGDGVTMSFSQVDFPGVTYANEVSGSPPANFKLVPEKIFYSITTTAGYSGIIELSIPYDDTGIPPAKEANLKLTVFNETTGLWEDITTYVDTENNIIYGETTHLSIFAIMWRENELPVATITGPSSGAIYEIGSTVQFTGTFTDADTGDTHSAYWTFTSQGVATTIEGTVTESGGSGSVSCTYTFTTQGVYMVTFTVTDNKGGSDTVKKVDDLPAMVVIYDPEGGFVTGGGWINSPEGAYEPDPSLTGKASFGFVAKYKKGASEPTGNTEFKFEVAELDFHSNDYKWLVIAGAKAQFKGIGTINDQGEYKFMIWATDGALLQEGGGVDMFRIKIWEEDSEDNELVVYDNGAESPLGGGQIKIHKS